MRTQHHNFFECLTSIFAKSLPMISSGKGIGISSSTISARSYFSIPVTGSSASEDEQVGLSTINCRLRQLAGSSVSRWMQAGAKISIGYAPTPSSRNFTRNVCAGFVFDTTRAAQKSSAHHKGEKLRTRTTTRVRSRFRDLCSCVVSGLHDSLTNRSEIRWLY